MEHVKENQRLYVNDDKYSVEIFRSAERLDDYRQAHNSECNLNEFDREDNNQFRDISSATYHSQRSKELLLRLV